MPLDYVVGVDFEGQVVVAADFQSEEADPEEADFEGQVVTTRRRLPWIHRRRLEEGMIEVNPWAWESETFCVENFQVLRMKNRVLCFTTIFS